MRMNPRAVALSLMLTAGLAAPALAQATDQPGNQPTAAERQQALVAANPDAFETNVPALTYSAQDDRRAAVTYLDDAIGLLDISRSQLAAGNVDMARVALMGASGKLTTAYLLNFRDRQFSQRIEPMAMRASQDLESLTKNKDANAAMGNLDALRGQVASLGQQQLAMLPNTSTTGGGGGGGEVMVWEDLNFLAVETPETVPSENLNLPDQDDVD